MLSISLSLTLLLFVFLPYSLFYLGVSCLPLVLVQNLPGNEHLTWIMEDAGSNAMPIHVPK